MEVAFDSYGREGVLSLEGELTIEWAETLKEVLLTAKKEVDSLEVRLDEVTRIDASCLQLFCAGLRSFKKENKVLVLKANAPNSCWKIVEETGYHTVLGEALRS